MSFLMNQKTAEGHTLSFGLTKLVSILKPVFTTAIQFDYSTIAGRIRELAFLNPEKPLHDIVGFRKVADGIRIDVALQCPHRILGYANSIRTIDGGTHIDGMKASLTRNQKISRKGLTCVISVKVADPEFEGQTKEYLELHPDVLDSILSKSLNALKAALAAKRARELVRQKSVLTSSSLPGKLADCSATNPEDSVGLMLAVLPLRVKILNIERKDKAAMYKNEEIQNLILGLGLGVKRALFDEGCIYVGVPPLYKVLRGERKHIIAMMMQNENSYKVPSLKCILQHSEVQNLGEMMPLQLLRETTLDPEKRLLKQFMVEDAAEANVVFSSLMGSRVDYRKELIQSSTSMINLDQLDI
ncbi:unnamed protein product [Camellia sinensis]